ncbi:gamma-interferon-inducible lysosomal thiol reductase-like [Carica papaya]|uniref:gamma-interferon-inducible lysosomal thiol reductase-like n=1 Tax=Carica papaya TaxID=3649 RepID=UPI000B8CE2B4|nr:gamma-interferon-inducible lysosomal thiol reductase-like [Carica papaya]
MVKMNVILNIIHACAINIWPDPEKHFGFIRCVENGGAEADEHSKEAEAMWKLCSKRWGLNEKAIEDCYNSGYGRKIVLQYGSETDHLNPPRTFVPWVTLNNQPLYGDYNNFVSYICKAYQGKTVPEGCRSPLSSSLTEKQNLAHEASCHTDEATNSILFNSGRNSKHNG